MARLEFGPEGVEHRVGGGSGRLGAEELSALERLSDPRLDGSEFTERSVLGGLASGMRSDLWERFRGMGSDGGGELWERGRELDVCLERLACHYDGSAPMGGGEVASCWSDSLRGMVDVDPGYSGAEVGGMADSLAGWGEARREYNLDCMAEAFTPGNTVLVGDRETLERLHRDLPFTGSGEYVELTGGVTPADVSGLHVFGALPAGLEGYPATVTTWGEMPGGGECLTTWRFEPRVPPGGGWEDAGAVEETLGVEEAVTGFAGLGFLPVDGKVLGEFMTWLPHGDPAAESAWRAEALVSTPVGADGARPLLVH